MPMNIFKTTTPSYGMSSAVKSEKKSSVETNSSKLERVPPKETQVIAKKLGMMSKMLQKMGLKPQPDLKFVVSTPKSELFSPKAGPVDVSSSTRTVAGDAAQMRNNQLDVYLKALESLKGKASVSGKLSVVQDEIDRVTAQKASPIEIQDGLAAKDVAKKSLGSKKDLAGTKTSMETLLKELGVKGDAKKLLLAARKDALNTDQHWVTKVGTIGNGDAAVTSTITPANGSVTGEVTSDTMTARGTTGTTCQSNHDISDRAANVQMTSLTRAGKTIFSGVRHAILATKSPKPSDVMVKIEGESKPISDLGKDELKSLLKDNLFESPDIIGKLEAKLEKGDLKSVQKALAKQVSNHNKALDILRTVVVQRLIENSELPKDGVISLHLTSQSLVTPDNLRSMFGLKYQEKQMLAEQTQALGLLSKLSPEDKTALLQDIKVGGKSLADSGVTDIAISTSTFNFGVNEGEAYGRANQAEQNVQAMKSLKSQVAKARADLKKTADDPVSAKQIKLLDTLEQKVDKEFAKFQSLDGAKLANPYALPALVAALNKEAGGSLCFNCMSGKDRTGMHDVMTKIFMTHLENVKESGGDVGKAVQYFDRMVDDQAFRTENQELNRDMLFKSGNREVQQENTTGWGYKLKGDMKLLFGTIKIPGNTEKMFDMMFGIKPGEIQGFSANFGA